MKRRHQYLRISLFFPLLWTTILLLPLFSSLPLRHLRIVIKASVSIGVHASPFLPRIALSLTPFSSPPQINSGGKMERYSQDFPSDAFPFPSSLPFNVAAGLGAEIDKWRLRSSSLLQPIRLSPFFSLPPCNPTAAMGREDSPLDFFPPSFAPVSFPPLLKRDNEDRRIILGQRLGLLPPFLSPASQPRYFFSFPSPLPKASRRDRSSPSPRKLWNSYLFFFLSLLREEGWKEVNSVLLSPPSLPPSFPLSVRRVGVGRRDRGIPSFSRTPRRSLFFFFSRKKKPT